MSDQIPAPDTAPDAAAEYVDAPDLYAFVVSDFERNLAGIVADLRRLADRIENTETPAPNQKNPDFGNTASVVISEITNMIPNLGMSGLVRSAAQADVALLHERAKTPR